MTTRRVTKGTIAARVQFARVEHLVGDRCAAGVRERRRWVITREQEAQLLEAWRRRQAR